MGRTLAGYRVDAFIGHAASGDVYHGSYLLGQLRAAITVPLSV